MDRREFHQLALAALGGLVTGTQIGCGPTGPAQNTESAKTNDSIELTETEKLILDEPHVCRGLNTCKTLGRGQENACAGQGACASVVDHACATQNECKGQGGCGTDPGWNSCKGQGSCHIPLMDEAWERARKAFEQAMQKTGREFGPAPAKV